MAESRESKLLISALKRCLKIKGVTYRDLASSMKLSESSIKRLFASNSLSLQRFEQVCGVVGLSIFDISKMAREEDEFKDPHTLSIEQEKALADDVKLLVGFHLILNGWNFNEIKDAFDWSEPEVIKIFTTLDKLALISLLPENKFKTLTAHNIRWRKDGAVRKRHQQMVFNEFLNDRFLEEDQLLDFEVLELSPASIKILKRKIGMLQREVNELATMDFSLKQGSKISTGIMFAMRPWVFSLAFDAMSGNYKKARAG